MAGVSPAQAEFETAECPLSVFLANLLDFSGQKWYSYRYIQLWMSSFGLATMGAEATEENGPVNYFLTMERTMQDTPPSQE